jgi:hypothetical protein
VDVRPLVRASVVGEVHRAVADAIALPTAVDTAQALLDRLKRAADGCRPGLDLLLRAIDDRRNQRLSVVGALGLKARDPGYLDPALRPFLVWVVVGTIVALVALAAVVRAGRRDRSAAER